MKWFTYCGNEHTGSTKGYQGSYTQHNRRSRYSFNRGHLGLLLHSDDETDPITDADVALFVQDPVIKELFPDGCFALPGELENDVIVTPSTTYTLLPDKATIETPKLRIVYDDVIQDVDLRQRYNSCKSLIKAIGCESCDERGVPCLKRAVGDDVPTQFNQSKDEDDVKELFKNRVTKAGPFTYISPRLTIPEKHYFVPSLRHYEDHDFGMIQTNGEKIGANNTGRAEYLRFKKQQCSKCPLQKSCGAYRHCVGPYPSEEEMAKQIIANNLNRFGDGFNEWQFWAVARSGNFRSRYNRYEITIHGMERSYRGMSPAWRAVIFRTKTRIRRVTEIDNYEELRRLFPELPDEETAKRLPYHWGRPENDVASALYLRLTEFSESARSFSAGWGRISYGILSKRLNNDHVRVRYCGPRYERHDSNMDSFAKFFDEISSHIGVSQTRVRETGYSND